MEITSATAVYEDLELRSYSKWRGYACWERCHNEEVTAMDNDHKQTNEIEVSVESCEIGIPVEAGRQWKWVCLSMLSLCRVPDRSGMVSQD